MSKYQDNLLAVRFAALEPESLPGDWDDVLARAGAADFPGPQQTRTTWLPRWQWRRVILAFALVAVGVVVTGSALATLGYQPLGGHRATAGHRHGSLDTSFGRGGKIKKPTWGVASALAIQQDGKLVAAGHSTSGRGFKAGFALVRYNANGTLDRSFGRGGRVTTPTGVAYALAIQQDGKLVVAGRSGRRFTLARYHTSGTLDTSFGRGGKVTTSIGGGGGGAHALAIQQDGKLVVAGRSRRSFTLARYNTSGTLDTSFGRGGKVTTSIGGGGGGASALAIQQDGKLVVAGGYDYGFVLGRYWP